MIGNLRLKGIVSALLLSLVWLCPGEGVAQVDPGQDADVVALVKEGCGADLKPGKFRISRPQGIGGVVLVGGTAKGPVPGRYSFQYAIVGGACMDAKAAGKHMLESQGWHQASPAVRAELAKEWVVRAEMAFQKVVSQPDKLFQSSGATYHGPRGDPDTKGGVVVRMWNSLPPKKTAALVFHRVQFQVSPDASIGEFTEIERAVSRPEKLKQESPSPPTGSSARS